MKKILLLAITALTLVGCQDKEQYRQAVLEQMKVDQDIKDYKLDPEDMASCVVDVSAENMPGVFAYDPKRMETYRSYAKMLTLNKAENPEQVLADLRVEFETPKGLADAHNNFSQSVLTCLTSMVSRSEEKLDKTEEQTPVKAPVTPPEQKPTEAPVATPVQAPAPAPVAPPAQAPVKDGASQPK